MTALSAAVADYLDLRRGLGFGLAGMDRLLGDFVAFLADAGLEVVTIDAALAWATRPAGAQPSWHAKRLGYVRGFAAYLHAFDPRHQVPPRDLLPIGPKRATPYIYSDDEIGALMREARRLAPPLRAATFEAVIGLLAATGMRAGEVMRLRRGDVDLADGVIWVWDSKFHHSRQLPLHPTTVAALAAYARRRHRLWPHPEPDAFFLSGVGTRLCPPTLDGTFARIRRAAGLEPPPRSGRAAPRLHDFRHTLAVRTLVDWYRAGHDIGARLQTLSTFLGHVDPAATYWYLSAIPELLALAAARMQQVTRAER
jgi:integrase/recombinase XerD